MIRYMCPSCGADSTAQPGDAGKVISCPACRTPIQLPGAPPPPPKGKPSANDPVEIHPCPKCNAALSVLAADLGTDIACPNCETVFTAVSADGPPPPPPKKSSAGKAKKVDRDDDDDDRPKRRQSKRRKSSMGLRDSRYRSFSPHDGVFMLVLSLVAVAVNGLGFCCPIGWFAGLLLSVFVIVKASLSVRDIKKGTMQANGRVLLEASRGLAVLNVLLSIGLIVFDFVLKSAPRTEL
jgi:DNA-directed RNA polymerase subunit RPC12/RpoP